MTDERPSTSERPDPLPLAAGAIEPCQQCGAPMPSADAVLCPECGYDMVRLKRHATVVGRPITGRSGADERSTAAPGTRPAEQRDREDHAEDTLPVPLRPALVAKRATTMPAAIAGLCAVILVAAALAGMTGLFPRESGLFRDSSGAFTQAAPRWPERFAIAGKLLVQTGIAALAGFGAMALVARVRGSRLGDEVTVLVRVLAIVAVSQLARLVSLPPPGLERLVESAAQAAVFVALVVAWFRFTFAEAGQALVATIVLVLLIDGAAWLALWGV